MTRLIPGKTKVSVELFKGVTIGDVVVGGIGMAMLLLVLVSNLPWKLGFCIGVLVVAALLLVRMDEQPNYIYILHILSYFGYKRSFARHYTDKMLIEAGAGRIKDAAFDELFKGESVAGDVSPKKSKKEWKAEARERKKEDKLLKSRKTPDEVKQAILEKRAQEAEEKQSAEKSVKKEPSDTTDGQSAKERKQSAKERKQQEKEREKRRKEEDKLLKSKDVPEEQKDEIRARRAEESKAAMMRLAEVKEEQKHRERMDEIIAFTGIKDGFIEYLNKTYYGAVIEIDPVEFRFFSEHRRANSIENCLGRILRSIHAGYSANIVKLERPIMYDSYLDREYTKLEALRSSYENGVLSEEELKARVEIEYDRINELLALCNDTKVVAPFYYLALFESDKRQLEMQIREAEGLLRNGELNVRRLDDKGLAIFLKYSNQIDFDERDVEKIRPEDLHLWAQPDTVDIKVRRVEVNHIITHNFRVVNYPTLVGDAYLAGVMSIPGTKVVVKCRPMDRAKAIRNIDHSLQELRGQWSATGVDSKRLEIETHLSTLQELLTTLQSDSESLLECNIYITAYDIVSTRKDYRIPQPPESELPNVNEMKKNVRRSWQESGYRLNNMEFDQVQAFIGSQISALDPMAKQGRGISSNTVAACFPWIFAHISDEGGIKLGESDGIPVFINFFRRDSERVNSNMVIVGKSGSGKSYSTKSLLTNLAAEDSKIFILDPENEYTELAHNLHGQIINVGNAQYGRLNPFHIITALDDDEVGEGGPSGSYATHLQFLEEFFRQIMPDCEKDAMEYLNTLVDRMYLDRNITPETDLSKLSPEDYPIFDDLYDQVLAEYQHVENQFTRDMLRALMNYIAKFSTGGRNANIWNGPSTVTTDENFTVFNFQSMLANRNTTIANAQMLLVLKYIDNEVIKNRDYNTKYKAQRKVVVVIDEAHVFIDAKFPIALDFMFQLAKRIRKYNGMQIVITQNIKDFVGSEELARKSTAIINACQYSFIFALAPNDMQDLVKLYEKAGGINENEQEQIVQAARGQAFAIMGPTSRSTFQIETAQGITDMFQEREYQSHYFSGEQGAINWEDFVAGSREAHDKAILSRWDQEEDIEEMAAVSGSSVVFEEVNEEELGAAPKKPGVVLFEEEDEDEEDADDAAKRHNILDEDDGTGSHEADDDAVLRGAASLRALDNQGADALAGLDPVAGGAAVGLIVSALGRVAEALERGGAIPAPAAASIQGPGPAAAFAATTSAVTEAPAAETDARESTASAEMETRLREMEERLAHMQDIQEQKDEMIRILREQNDQLRSAPPESAELEESSDSEPSFEIDLSSDEIQNTDFAWDEDEAAGAEIAWDEGEDAGAGIDWGTDEESGVFEEENEEDADFLSALNSYATALTNMTVFERMRNDGETVLRITLDDLTKAINVKREKGSYF